jgi:hypothetical protein
MVSCADKIHNMDSFIRDVASEGDAFKARFGSSIRNRLWFHEQVLILVTRKLGDDHALIKRLRTSTEAFRQIAAVEM